VAERSKTVDKALALLLALGDGDGAGDGARRVGQRVSDLAGRTGQSPTAALRLLTSLEHHGFVRRTTEGYALGAALLGLGLHVEPLLRSAARPRLAGLAARFGETAVLTLRDGHEAVAVDQVLGPDHRVVQVRYRPGHRHSLAEAAHGRAMLAFVPPAVLDGVLASLPDDQADLVGRELEVTRGRGYVFSSGELEPGAAGLAAPILDQAGVAVASIGVVAPAPRLPDPTELAGAVVEAARSVGSELSVPIPQGRS
jgi:DNA-binding IclR family transcriptional regulator